MRCKRSPLASGKEDLPPCWKWQMESPLAPKPFLPVQMLLFMHGCTLAVVATIMGCERRCGLELEKPGS